MNFATFLSPLLNLFRKGSGGSVARTSSSPASAPVHPTETPAFVIAGPLNISGRSRDLIIEFEVGDRTYYDRRLSHPTWPGGASGVTIGFGYDLGYNTPAQIRADWVDLPPSQRDELARLAGVKGQVARKLVPTVAHIKVPWVVAEKVFSRRTLPRFGLMAATAFPGLAGLKADIQGALLSIVFNRGASMTGDSRSEMREIKEAIKSGNLKAIPPAIRSMKRLWKNKGLDGLLRRRDAEAKLVESAL